MTVHQFPRASDVAPPGDGGDNGNMEARLARIETRLDGFERVFATKADLSDLRADMHKEFTAQTWRFVTWMSTICAAMVAAVYFIARNVH